MSKSNNESEATRRTVVEEGTRFKGDLTSSCPIDVRGHIEGDIQAPSLTVSAAGSVHGMVKVGSVHSKGELSGDFEAERIEISGTIKDKTVIRARSIEVRLSSNTGQQVVFGDCELSIGDEPTEHDILAESEAVAEPTTHAEQMHGEQTPEYHEPAAQLLAPGAQSLEAGEDEAARVTTTEPDSVPSNIAEALSSEANAGPGSKRTQAPNGMENGSGWSQPPSQPPPAHE